jgi:uncharacterized protein
MKRNAIKDLYTWKEDPMRKPLILQGVRQVGKTWLVNQFGKDAYKNYIRFNLEENEQLHLLFESTLNPVKLIEKLSLHVGKRITENDTLLFFDEIQACPRALTSLKYFNEDAPKYHIIAAGSLLGVRVTKPSSFPVGKVNFLNIHPLNFYEFLLAFDEKLLAEYLLNHELVNAIDESLHDKLTDYFKLHLYLGGMPEVVNDYLQKRNPTTARKIQNEILESYRNDFSKYSTPLLVVKISEIWDSIPYQLAKENKKFKYSNVKEKARSSSYETTLFWLKKAGLIHIVHQVRDVKLPLNGYSDLDKYKLYLVDTGLLGAMLDLSSSLVVAPTSIFKEYNGALVENYVCTELVKLFQKDIHYWTYERGNAEVDFIFQYNDKIIPVEVKSGTNKNTQGLRNFEDKYKPYRVFRASPRNIHTSGTFTNLPLYLLFVLPKVLGVNEEW